MPIDRSQLITKEDKLRIEHEKTLVESARVALTYLRETDWYVVRAMETDKPVPDEVLVKRAQARIDIDLAEGL